MATTHITDLMQLFINSPKYKKVLETSLSPNIAEQLIPVTMISRGEALFPHQWVEKTGKNYAGFIQEGSTSYPTISQGDATPFVGGYKYLGAEQSFSDQDIARMQFFLSQSGDIGVEMPNSFTRLLSAIRNTQNILLTAGVAEASRLSSTFNVTKDVAGSVKGLFEYSGTNGGNVETTGDGQNDATKRTWEAKKNVAIAGTGLSAIYNDITKAIDTLRVELYGLIALQPNTLVLDSDAYTLVKYSKLYPGNDFSNKTVLEGIVDLGIKVVEAYNMYAQADCNTDGTVKAGKRFFMLYNRSTEVLEARMSAISSGADGKVRDNNTIYANAYCSGVFVYRPNAIYKGLGI
jgi:hypothetical protein